MRALLALLVFPLVAAAAPPVVTVPAEVKGGVSEFVVVRAEVKDGKGVKFVPLDAGLSVFPAGLLSDPNVTVVVGARSGKYRILCYSGTGDGPSDPALTTVVIGGGSGVPIIDPPQNPPADPPAKPSGKFFFFLVPPATPLPPEIGRVVSLPAWDELRKDGHQMKLYTRAELDQFFKQSAEEDAAAYKRRLDSYVGRLVVSQYSEDGKRLVYDRVADIPKTDADVKALVK